MTQHLQSTNLVKSLLTLFLLSLFSLVLMNTTSVAKSGSISRGQTLPDAKLIGHDKSTIHLHELKGRVKILSMVPQLNTPVCDEQTHRFSERNEGLEEHLEIVTISTNTHNDQQLFAEKADIENITFLSDSPDFDFGTKTGLLHPMHHILQRAVMVVDEHNMIRYIEIVPMGQLPNFTAALDAARRVLGLHAS